MKALIIDDNQTITTVIQKYLKMKNIDCTIANDGRSGLTFMLGEKFDVVLLDLAIPGFSGIDILESLMNLGKIKEQRVIIFTASSIPREEVDRLIQNGVSGFLSKPIRMETLLKTLS